MNHVMINSDEVRMWVYEETLQSGEKLTDVINRTNVRTSHAFHSNFVYNNFQIEYYYSFWKENVKYLPGIKLGKNVVADPDLENAGTNLVFFEIFFSVFYTVFTI